MHLYTVLSAYPKGHRKHLSVIDPSKKQMGIAVPRFCSVGKGDTVAVDPEHPTNVFVLSREDKNDLIRLSPHFETELTIQIGSLPIMTRITEINRQDDLEFLAYLEKFHYRSTPFQDDDYDLFGNVKPLSLGGRRAVLVLYLRIGESWQAVGYIELQMPLMMAKPRHKLFDNPFLHRTRPIQWGVWDSQAMKKYLNLIVRVRTGGR